MENQNQEGFNPNSIVGASAPTPQPMMAQMPPQEMPPAPMPQMPIAPEAGQIKYAGFWVRFAASFIDGLIVVIPAVIIDTFLNIILAVANVPALIASAISYLFILIVMYGYPIFMINKYQATLGKMALGIKVFAGDGSKLSIGKIVLRETIGKIISQLIFDIGYIMAGFTERKRALHDMMVDSVVVYKDPSKKSSGVIIAVVIIVIVFMITVIGIFASIVLVSLSSARSNAQDAAVKSTIGANIAGAILFEDANSTYKGYTPGSTIGQIACSGSPIVNISPDGKQLAIFMKSCKNPKMYFCGDTKTSLTSNTANASESYALSGNSVCP